MYKITTVYASRSYIYCVYNLILFLVNSKPTKKKLLDHVVARVTPLWYDLGIALFNEDQELNLDIIKSNYTVKKTCCKEMFWHWLSTDTSASWQKLIQALRSPSVELFVVADDLEKMLIGT